MPSSFRLLLNRMCVTPPIQVKYKDKYEKAKGQYMTVQDTPQILHAKSVRNLASEVSPPILIPQVNREHITLNTTFIMHVWIILLISRANTRRPARRKCRVAPSPPCRRLVTLPTAGRSRSLSVGYGCLKNIHPKTNLTSFTRLAFITFWVVFFCIAESVQGQV